MVLGGWSQWGNWHEVAGGGINGPYRDEGAGRRRMGGDKVNQTVNNCRLSGKAGRDAVRGRSTSSPAAKLAEFYSWIAWLQNLHEFCVVLSLFYLFSSVLLAIGFDAFSFSPMVLCLRIPHCTPAIYFYIAHTWAVQHCILFSTPTRCTEWAINSAFYTIHCLAEPFISSLTSKYTSLKINWNQTRNSITCFEQIFFN